MPAKEIKELRQAGKLEEALAMAKEEFEFASANINHETLFADLENILATSKALSKLEGTDFNYNIQKEEIKKNLVHFELEWPKRNLSWVYYEYLKQSNAPDNFEEFLYWLNEIKNLDLPFGETMLFEKLCWQIGKMAFGLFKSNPVDVQKRIKLFETIKSFPFPKQTEGYSFLFKALHKALKETDRYLNFADWWNFENFLPEDFLIEKIPNGKEVMAVAEQAYIAYSKHLLPVRNQFGETVFDEIKAKSFLPLLEKIVDQYPQFQYPPYFLAKLLLALGDKEHMLSALLPFAKKKQNNFWVWTILAEALTWSKVPDQVFACYCKALLCKSPEEMLVSLRQKMAANLIYKGLLPEAKTEIETLVATRTTYGFKMPDEILAWQNEDWYNNTVASINNKDLYKKYAPIAEDILFSDVTEEYVFVEFVNRDKKILNFIASEQKFGYFKYDRFINEAKIGDVLKVRFQGGSVGEMYKANTVVKIVNEEFKKQFFKEVEGFAQIKEGKNFGFIDNIFIHPSIISKNNIINGMQLKGLAMKSFNKEKNQWGWKYVHKI